MKSLRNISMLLAVSLIVFSGCVKLRDYTGIREGAFGLDIKKGFGEGGEKKDYCVFEDGADLVIGDKKSEVTLKIGLPDKVESTLEGYESWLYESRKIKLYFKGERLEGWNFL